MKRAYVAVESVGCTALQYTSQQSVVQNVNFEDEDKLQSTHNIELQKKHLILFTY